MRGCVFGGFQVARACFSISRIHASWNFSHGRVAGVLGAGNLRQAQRVSWLVGAPNRPNGLPGTDVIEYKSLCFDFVCKLSGHSRRTVASGTRLLNHRIAL